MQNDEPLLAIENLTVIYGSRTTGVPAVAGACFEVGAGEIVGILGESGSGKSTLAAAILGLLDRDSTAVTGSVTFGGQELVGLSERELQEIRGSAISMVPQEPRIGLNPVRQVGGQVAEVARAHSPLRGLQLRSAVFSALNAVQLDAHAIYHAYPNELSGGQCQRVAIAQALVGNPRLVIADEPTASLDSTVQSEILELIGELRRTRGVAFLLITHNPAIVAKLADRMIVMQAGHIVEQGEVSAVIQNPTNPFTNKLLLSRGKLLRSFPAGS